MLIAYAYMLATTGPAHVNTSAYHFRSSLQWQPARSHTRKHRQNQEERRETPVHVAETEERLAEKWRGEQVEAARPGGRGGVGVVWGWGWGVCVVGGGGGGGGAEGVRVKT